MIDAIKTLLGFFFFFVVAPTYGLAIANRPKMLIVNLVIIVVATTMPHTWWSFQIQSIERYHGHTRGFEVNLLAVIALSSVIAMLRGPHRIEKRVLAPASLLFAFWIFASSLSVVNALEPAHVFMSIVKFSAALIVFVAAYNSVRGASDLRILQNTIAAALIWQLLIVLKLKYLNGIYRARGNFPHSNNLGMYSYMTGLYLLAVVQQVKMPTKRLILIAGGYVSGMAMAFMTISRACFAAAIVGSGGIMALSIFVQPRFKKMALASTLILPVAVGAAKAADQVLARVEGSRGNTKVDELGTFRNALENQAKAMLADHPLGIGWNNFSLASSRPRGDYAAIMENYMYAVHGYRVSIYNNALIENLYWMILGETGYLAFIAFVLFQLRLLHMAWGSLLKFRGTELGAGVVGMSVILPVLYVHWYLERIIANTPELLIFLVLTGVLARINTWRQQINRGELTQEELLAR